MSSRPKKRPPKPSTYAFCVTMAMIEDLIKEKRQSETPTAMKLVASLEDVHRYLDWLSWQETKKKAAE